ncbi:MAG: hypothetical protein IJC15_05885 [Clostridia bacterium]|nr:hypothetical protein [Clostridia bacterium]
MELFRDILYYGLPTLLSLYVCGKLYPKLNPEGQKGRIGVVYLLACLASVAGIFLVNAFMWVTIGFLAIIA